VYAKFRCAPLPIKKALGIYRELISTKTGREGSEREEEEGEGTEVEGEGKGRGGGKGRGRKGPQ